MIGEAKIIHFPIDKRMPTRIAEEKVGPVVMYKYPSLESEDPFEWLTRWLEKKSVLLGWESVKEGLVASFKSARVRHLISRVQYVDPDFDERPKVEICCGFDSYPIFNWVSEDKVASIPVIVLGERQTSYFRLCKRCEMRQK
jgi:hypothetical protein